MRRQRREGVAVAENRNLVDAAQATVDAVEEFWKSGCRGSYMVDRRSGDVFRAMRNAWMVARSCRSVAQGSGGGFIGNPNELLAALRRIRSFVEMASRAELDTATVRQALQNIGGDIDGVENLISGSLLDRHVLAEWMAAVREVDAKKAEMIRHQEVFNKQIERWEHVAKTSFDGGKPYEAEASGAHIRAVCWALGAGLLAAGTVWWGFSLDVSGGGTGRTLGDALYASAGRWVAFATLLGAVAWCGRRASANAHLAAIARDRALAWESYHVLLASGGGASEAATALVAKLADTPSTGFLSRAALSTTPSLPWKVDS